MQPSQDTADWRVLGWRASIPSLPWALSRLICKSLRLLVLLPLWLFAAGGTQTGQSESAPASETESFRAFEKDIWPLLTRGGADSCVGCHDPETKSELHLPEEAKGAFQTLLQGGYFFPGNPDGLLGRLTSTNPQKRMPKGRACPSWTEAEITKLREFVGRASQGAERIKRLDEEFPHALLLPYKGPARPTTLDNQFISYRQLKGKVKAIFGDDWVRNGRDLFQENIALFGGADFKERFNETVKASPPFLTGLGMLARDVVERAYSERTGPFVGHRNGLSSPLDLEMPNSEYIEQITHLYEELLFRAPTGAEIQEAYGLIRNIYRSAGELRAKEYELGFLLTVEDGETHERTEENVDLKVMPPGLGLYQEYVDESRLASASSSASSTNQAPKGRRRQVSGQIVRQRLNRTFHFNPRQSGQFVRIYNANTVGNVSFQSIELRPVGALDSEDVVISATNSLVQPEGAWKLEQGKDLASYEDENNDKGSSTITIGIEVLRQGEYELELCWRENKDNAKAVLVEVFSSDGARLASHPAAELPPRGEAHYFIDQSNDSVAFARLASRFRFGTNDYVEINNRGTQRRVTADAVKFVSAASGTTLLIDNDEAEGREHWQEYDSGAFKAYNQTGKNTYHDENAHKGELFLRYLPSKKAVEWKSNEFYRVEVGYPAKEDHEIHTPVIVRAMQSAPIVQVARPHRAQAGSEVNLDASRSYTVQQSALRFRWRQVKGPTVQASHWNEAQLAFEAPEPGAHQAAWEALARALMEHPDFVFTRPPSVMTVTDPRERRRLQLVKIAQDLLARTPTREEIDAVNRGRPLEQIVDDYLATKEFQDFYFHRIRLYFESQGTEVQDEPARLWCYVAFQNRPFQEILTADYTVDAHWEKKPRPPWHGRTGVLTTHGFIEGKPGLPHFNYAAQVAELFLGYIFEVPPEVVAQREGSTAASTTDPNSLCYNCHKVLTPLATQRLRWDDLGRYRSHDEYGLPIDDSDQGLVSSYPFAGNGLEAFARQAVQKERFIRTIINTHFVFYFGREMRYLEEERRLYSELWDEVHKDHFAIRSLIKALVTSPEYLGGAPVDRTTLSSHPSS